MKSNYALCWINHTIVLNDNMIDLKHHTPILARPLTHEPQWHLLAYPLNLSKSEYNRRHPDNLLLYSAEDQLAVITENDEVRTLISGESFKLHHIQRCSVSITETTLNPFKMTNPGRLNGREAAAISFPGS